MIREVLCFLFGFFKERYAVNSDRHTLGTIFYGFDVKKSIYWTSQEGI